MERGLVANPFEFRPLGVELALCQRYYQKSYDLLVAPGAISTNGCAGRTVDATCNYPGLQIPFCTSMRAGPTVTVYSPTTGAAGKIRDFDAAADINAIVSYQGQNGASIFVQNVSVAANHAIGAQWTASAEL